MHSSNLHILEFTFVFIKLELYLIYIECLRECLYLSDKTSSMYNLKDL